MDTGDGYFQPVLQVPMLTTPRDSFNYNMDHTNRGICLILDYVEFDRNHVATRGLPSRVGSGKDSKDLAELFQDKLGFQVSIYKNLTLVGTQQILRQAAMFDHSDSDCFVCVVLTHGLHGELYAYDGKYHLEILYKYFLNDACPTLVGKPKLFFVQACQGSRTDSGVVVQSRDALDSPRYFKIPTHADFLCAYSSIPGFYSFRNTHKGAWFIRALIEVLEKFHNEHDLLTMMTIVCQRVAYDYTSKAPTKAMSDKKQVPCITSMLTRRVFLVPKSRAIAL